MTDESVRSRVVPRTDVPLEVTGDELAGWATEAAAAIDAGDSLRLIRLFVKIYGRGFEIGGSRDRGAGAT